MPEPVDQVQFEKNERLDANGTLCCWCYKISRKDGQTFRSGETWGINLQAATIRPPGHFVHCSGCSVQRVTTPTGSESWIVYKTLTEDVASFSLGFPAACRGDESGTLSFESRVTGADGSPTWIDQNAEGTGENEMLTPIRGYPVRSSSVPDVVAFLAQYEGMKLRHLQGEARG